MEPLYVCVCVCVCVCVTERERKWLCSARVLISWTDAPWPGPVPGSLKQAALDLCETTGRVPSPTWLRRQPLHLKLISGVPRSLPGRDPALLWAESSFLKIWALLSGRRCPRESAGPRKQLTSLTPSPAPPNRASSQLCTRQHRTRVPILSGRKASRHPHFAGVCEFSLSLWLWCVRALPSLTGIPVRNKAGGEQTWKPRSSLSGVSRPGSCALGAGRGGVCLLMAGGPGLGRGVRRQDHLYQPSSPTTDLGRPCEYGTRGGLVPGDLRLDGKFRGLGGPRRV